MLTSGETATVFFHNSSFPWSKTNVMPLFPVFLLHPFPYQSAPLRLVWAMTVLQNEDNFTSLWLLFIHLFVLFANSQSVDGLSSQKPIAASSHLPQNDNHAICFPFCSLFMGLCTHLFQIIAHFRLFLKVILNFYLQTLADPLNLFFWDTKKCYLGIWVNARLWIAPSVTLFNSYSSFSVVTV